MGAGTAAGRAHPSREPVGRGRWHRREERTSAPRVGGHGRRHRREERTSVPRARQPWALVPTRVRSGDASAARGPRPGTLSRPAPVSDPPGRQVRVEGTFVPRRPRSRGGRSGRSSRSRQPVARGAGRGWGYGIAGDVSRDGPALCGGTAGAARVRKRAGLGAGPRHAHVSGRDVPALWQQAGAGSGGARIHREDALLSGGGLIPVEPRQAGRGLRPGVPRLLVGTGQVGADAAGPLRLHVPALACARVWAALAAGSRASGGRGAHSAAVVRWDDACAGARRAGERRAGGSAATRLRPDG